MGSCDIEQVKAWHFLMSDEMSITLKYGMVKCMAKKKGEEEGEHQRSEGGRE